MGKLIEGKWHDVWYDTRSHGGRFVREGSSFRNWITKDGSPGPSGKGGIQTSEKGEIRQLIASFIVRPRPMGNPSNRKAA